MMRLARLSSIELIAQPGHMPGQVNLVVRGHVAVLDVRNAIDFAAERARLAKEMAKADADIARVDAKLGNANFVARAPEEVVEEEKEKRGVIDLAAERARLVKEMQKAEADIARVDAKLGNANFVARAPEEVVEEEKEKRAEAVGRKAKIAEALERLKGAT